ncbi:MAG: thiamine phosphate synthase [Thermodesulfovibrionales bacterium]|nr:thiamine phosphate synthase [Thermodesulfovibrionales bacterium]
MCPSSEVLKDLIKRVEILLEEGIRWIQYRGKETSKRIQYRDCLLIRELTRRYNALLIVNDFIDLALAVNADGVHLGQDDIPIYIAKKIFAGRIIGISTHSLTEAIAATEAGASYIGYGPIFPTLTKDAGTPKGPESIKEIKRYVKIPVVAIGGIKAENVISVMKNGADAVAVSSGIIDENPEINVRAFLKAIEEFRSATHS